MGSALGTPEGVPYRTRPAASAPPLTQEPIRNVELQPPTSDLSNQSLHFNTVPDDLLAY